jgi:Uma2 family endonuclease
MNAPVRTRAADGLDRRAFTVDEVKAMVRAGIMDESEPVELWEGEFVVMNAKRNRHEIWKRRLARWLSRALPDEVAVAVEPSLYLGERTFLEPDILLHDDALLPEDVRGPDCLLVIEIADSTLGRDLTAKAGLYARYGVRHYWVLDAEGRRAHRLSDPANGAYQVIAVDEADVAIALPFAPELWVRLADLG